jgi:hypothetical protein
MAATAGVALLVSVGAANAQTPPASTNDKSDKTTQMNSAPSSDKGASPKSSMSQKHATTNHKAHRHLAMRHHYRASTTGAGGRVGPIGGAQNDPSIHQSIQRDSRGTPKGPGSDYNK